VQWDAIQDEDIKAEMIAHYNVENQMASYEALLREKEMNRRNIK